jgi:hypothetical protein
MVAESIEIFAPMLQLGCARACSGVAAAISWRLLVRNGPPEAVRIRRSMRSAWSKSKTWWIALCSESTGSRIAPVRRQAAITMAPAQTRASLLASATMAPRSMAESVGASPAAPVIADITQSAGRAAASTRASGPAPTAIPLPESSLLRSS